MGNPVPLVPAEKLLVTLKVSDYDDFLKNIQFVFQGLLLDTRDEVDVYEIVLTPEEKTQVEKWKQIWFLLEDLKTSKKRYSHRLGTMEFKRCEYVEVAKVKVAEVAEVVYKETVRE